MGSYLEQLREKAKPFSVFSQGAGLTFPIARKDFKAQISALLRLLPPCSIDLHWSLGVLGVLSESRRSGRGSPGLAGHLKPCLNQFGSLGFL